MEEPTADAGIYFPKIKPKVSRVNGAKIALSGEKLAVPLSALNLEKLLEQKYGNGSIRKTARNGAYEFFVDLTPSQTSEEIREYMLNQFEQKPEGIISSYKCWNKGNLFLYYRTETETYHVGFRNISLPNVKP